MGAGGGHETSNLGEYGNQGILTQKSGFPGHIGPGHKPQPACGADRFPVLMIIAVIIMIIWVIIRPGTIRREVAIIGHEGGRTACAQEMFDNRVAPAFDAEGQAVIHPWPAKGGIPRQGRESRGHVEPSQRPGGKGDGLGGFLDLTIEAVEYLQLQSERTVGRARDP